MTDAPSIIDRIAEDGWLPPAVIAANVDPDSGDITLACIHGHVGSDDLPTIDGTTIGWGQSMIQTLEATREALPDAPRGTILDFTAQGRPALASLSSSAIQAACGRLIGMDGARPWFAFRPSHLKTHFAIALVGPRMTEIQFYEVLSRGRRHIAGSKPIRLALPLQPIGSMEIPSGGLPRIAADGGMIAGSSGPEGGGDRHMLWVKLVHHLRFVLNPKIDTKLGFPEAIADCQKLRTVGITETEFRALIVDLLTAFPAHNNLRAISFTSPREREAWCTEEANYALAQEILHQDPGADIDPKAYVVACALLAAAKPYGLGPRSGGDVNPMLAADMLADGIFWIERVDPEDVNGHEQLLATERLADFLAHAQIEKNARRRALEALGVAN